MRSGELGEVFGRVCAHFAGTTVAGVGIVGAIWLQPLVLVWVLTVIGITNGIFGLAAYLELRRVKEVEGKGMSEKL